MRKLEKYQYDVDDPTVIPKGFDKWRPLLIFKIFLYFMFCFIAIANLPNNIWDPQYREVTLIIGLLGIWRFGWWFTHAIRSLIYKHLVYPKLRASADQVVASGWKARHVHFMMTTYKEHRQVTELVIQSIIDQVKDLEIPGTIWLGSGDIYDEKIISDYLRLNAKDLDLTLVMIRQNQPGKRLAIGLVLRAMNRQQIQDDDIVVFMDGDSILGRKCVINCASLFLNDPDLQAVTTDEELVCYGPNWVRTWLEMRFAQRRIAMQSHALSKKVLTLTGRMSVFRAKHLSNLRMIRLLEADYLNHWLWGSFRFLSGDDKSTWYYMLLQNAKMLYAPDAIVYTVEFIEGNGLDRMVQNFRRWSGNMLRNGTRALLLGPKKVGFFIWWCVLDQRIAMWTMLVSPLLALMTALLHTPIYLVSYAIWIAVSRMALSMVLFTYMRRPKLSVPFILYFNQLINASVKVYCLFRLSKQRWSNRGDQRSADGEGILEKLRVAMASYLTFLYMGILCLIIILYSELLTPISLNMATTLMSDFF